MSIRRSLLFLTWNAMGDSRPSLYRAMQGVDRYNNAAAEFPDRLGRLLQHCETSVPYYAQLLQRDTQSATPLQKLLRLPVLTKETIRQQGDNLASIDRAARSCFYNTSGGSTGEPVRLLQDSDYAKTTAAIALAYSSWTGCHPGDSEIRLWGSERDILEGGYGLRSRLVSQMTGIRFQNAFRMDSERMRSFIKELNRRRPKLLLAYTQAVYELALFAREHRLRVAPQHAVMTSAGTLYPFMRSVIQSVFQCPVFNRYGSREIGSIACECGAGSGLHVAPWGSWVEILDDEGNPLPPGEEGNIVVTCLSNYAMPLLRYNIGDRGALSSERCSCGREGQILARVSGRNVDCFRTASGTLVDGEYFTHLLYFRDWVKQFQVVQHSHSQIEFRIVQAEAAERRSELEDIRNKTQVLMGRNCDVVFSFPEEIESSANGKYRYTISHITGAQIAPTARDLAAA